LVVLVVVVVLLFVWLVGWLAGWLAGWLVVVVLVDCAKICFCPKHPEKARVFLRWNA